MSDFFFWIYVIGIATGSFVTFSLFNMGVGAYAAFKLKHILYKIHDCFGKNYRRKK